jgi:NADPH:quinone reductase-like Zn-dependent oxidoreductase
MRTVTQTVTGDPSVLTVIEVDRPEPDFGQVLIRVGAAGINPVDISVRAGSYPLLGEPPYTLGWDAAGVIESVAPGISAFAPGDQVLGLLAFPAAGNAYAEYVVASANEIVHSPAGLTVEEAGGLPLAGLTAWQALVGIAQITSGQRVLIHAAAGGVGHLAVQIAKTRGAYVIGTASAGKHNLVRALGADEMIDYTATDFSAVLSDLDVVFDLVGGEYGARSARILKPGGVLVGAIPTNLGVTPEEASELGVRAQVVRVRPSASDLIQLSALVAEGRLRVHVDQAFALEDVAKAHELSASGRTSGKLVLVP